uniref:MEGF10_11 n=1 Tax=Magallana gigas TaxID=29159 RepID=A0A8W8K4C3_MAGGI
MMIYGCVLTVFLGPVLSNDGGCHVNDWPHSCQANFIIGAQSCEPCESGRYGCNCSKYCPDNTYGQGCYHVCKCSDDEFCNHVTGCTKKSSVLTEPTGKMLNQLQSSASRAEDTNIYSDYEFADPLNTETNIYDQSSRASYDILVLRNQSSKVNIYDSDCYSDIIPPRSKPDYKCSPINYANKEVDFELEPECLLNLFKEEEKDVSPSCESGSYGCYCSEQCPYGTYGQGCYHVCDCSNELFCDPVVGCTNNSMNINTTTATESTHSSGNTLSSSSNTANQQNTHTGSGVTPLQSLTTSLIVSIMTVIVFSTICACILIRVSKRFYKREYRKLQNLWQSNESTAGDSNIYSVYDYTGSFVAPSSTVPPILDNNMYDQSDQSNTASYNILSLRNFPSTINDYDEDCNSVMLPPRSKFSGCENERREFDFDIEPECLLNLFKEEGDKAPCRSSNPDIMQSELDGEKESYHSTRL